MNLKSFEKLHFPTIDLVIAKISETSHIVIDLPTTSYWLVKHRVLLLDAHFKHLNNKK